MEKSLKVVGILILVIFGYFLTMFAVTDDIVYGTWAILLALVMRIRVTINSKGG